MRVEHQVSHGDGSQPLQAALGVVGATPDAILDLLGSSIDAGSAYLVGSLAAGLGSARSDIDIHVLDATAPRATGAQMLYFLNRTLIDVVHHHPDDVADILGSVPSRQVEFADGVCGLAPTLPTRTHALLGRWLTALPLSRDWPVIVPDGLSGSVVAANARGAFSLYMQLLAVAMLIELAKGAERAEAAWSRAARALLETVARARGDSFAGDKWVWRKARRVGIPEHHVRAFAHVRSRSDLEQVSRALGIEACDPLPIVSLALGNIEPVAVRDQRLVLVDRRRLVDAALATPGPLLDVLDAIGPARALQAIGFGALRLNIMEEGMDAWLTSGS